MGKTAVIKGYCASVTDSHPAESVPVERERQFCMRTSQGRIARLRIYPGASSTTVLLSTTVWDG
jgi:hypothetical protein